MPDKPKTQHRSVRVPDERWAASAEATEELGTDRAGWINEALAWLTREPGARMPRRPKRDRPQDQ